MENNIGTITWFEITKGEMPPRTPGDDYTNNLTLYNKNLDQFCRGAYVHSINEWRHGTGNWQPTHWSYINYP